MRILIDTDVLLDVALDRTPHSEASARVLEVVETGSIEAVVAWHTISNLYYLLASSSPRKQALAFIRDLSSIVDVARVDSNALKIALSLDLTDFEDSMQVASALSAEAEVIVTRNTRHFRKSPVRAIRPSDLELE